MALSNPAAEAVDRQLATYLRDGYVILPELLAADELAAIGAALEPYLEGGAAGRNDFEGERTRRVYSLVGRGKVFEDTVEHPAVLALVDRLLAPGYLLTASQAICLYPGETPQPVHYDDTFYPLPRPRKAISVSTIWALDAFTVENGATHVIPGSHLWSDAEVANTYAAAGTTATLDPLFAGKLQPAVMAAGSCILFAGTLLHRGGHNRSTARRRAFSHQYCEPWARQQENFCLSVPHDRAARMSERLRRLLGYSIHPPFMGQIAGRHPQKVLEPGYRNSLAADDDKIGRR